MLAVFVACLLVTHSDTTITVSVRGEVASPHTYTLAQGACVLNAISAAGGANSESANLTRVTLRRAGSTECVPIDLSRMLRAGDVAQNFALCDGDVLDVPASASRFVWVRSLRAACPVKFEAGLTLGAALRSAAWAPAGDDDAIRVERPPATAGGQTIVFTFRTSRLMVGPDAPVSFELSPGDVVNVMGGTIKARPPSPVGG
jgi:hypothetical protein